MQKKSTWIIILVLVIIAAGVAHVIQHNSNKNTSSSNEHSSLSIAKGSVVVTKSSSGIGNYLADVNGNTLYIYSSDSTGVSNCKGSCLSVWLPYQDKGSTSGLPSNVGTIKRTDNAQIQYTYKGKPLYYFSSDRLNHVTGNGISGFIVAKP